MQGVNRTRCVKEICVGRAVVWTGCKVRRDVWKRWWSGVGSRVTRYMWKSLGEIVDCKSRSVEKQVNGVQNVLSKERSRQSV